MNRPQSGRPSGRPPARSVARHSGRVAAVFGLLAALAVTVAGAAAAHVTITGEAAQGGYATLAFQVPNERDAASTTKLAVQFPTDHPITSVRTEPVPGWTAAVEMTPLDTPIEREGGDPITEVVGTVTWTGSEIKPGEFRRFPFSVGPLPTDTDELVFKAVQTYSDGEEVAWIETAADGEEAEHPAPVLALSPASGDAHGHGADSPTTTAASPAGSHDDDDDHDAAGEAAAVDDLASEDDVDSARTLGIVGIVVGALGLVVAAVALLRKPKAARP